MLTRSIGFRFSAGIVLDGLCLLLPIPASILLNRLLGADGRGALATMMLMPTLVSTFVTAQWERTLRGEIASGRLRLEEAWFRTIRYAIAMSFVGIVVCAILVQTQGHLSGSEKVLAVVFATVNLPTAILGTFAISFLTAANRLRAVYWSKLAGPALYLVLSIIFSITGLTLRTALAANASFWLAGCSVACFFISRIKLPPVPAGYSLDWPGLFQALPSYLSEVSGGQADIWCLSTFATPGATGAYASFKMFEMPTKIVMTGILSVSAGTIKWTDSSSVRRFIPRATAALALAAMVTLCLVLLIGPLLVGWILGKDYSQYSWMLAYMSVASGLTLTGYFLLNALQLRGSQTSYLRIQAIDGVSRWGFTLVGFFLGGTVGALIGLCLSGLWRSVMCAVALIPILRNDGGRINAS